MKLIYTAFGIVAVFFAVTFILPMQKLHAEDVLQMNSNQVVMSGTITDMNLHDFVLSTGDASTTVSLDSMPVSAPMKDLLKPGMKVTVRGTMVPGRFNEPEIKANSISAYQETLAPGAPVPPTGSATAPTSTPTGTNGIKP